MNSSDWLLAHTIVPYDDLVVALDDALKEQRQRCADAVFVCNTDAGKTPLEKRRILEQVCLNAGVNNDNK